MIEQLGTVTLEADTFDMVKLVAAGRTRQALEKLNTLLALQNDPILITGALIANYLDVYRAFLAKRAAARWRTLPKISATAANGTTVSAMRSRRRRGMTAAASSAACRCCRPWTWT